MGDKYEAAMQGTTAGERYLLHMMATSEPPLAAQARAQLMGTPCCRPNHHSQAKFEYADPRTGNYTGYVVRYCPTCGRRLTALQCWWQDVAGAVLRAMARFLR